jgi:hypothetical protein
VSRMPGANEATQRVTVLNANELAARIDRVAPALTPGARHG